MPAALDQSYDGIIVGAGHHGLVLGSYLQKCGLNILLVDRRLQYGGAIVTEEVTAPGFYHNLHSINHFHISETPWFKDLGLDERVTYITPRYEFGQAHGGIAGSRCAGSGALTSRLRHRHVAAEA
jgi:phytoene dehydrogenase-like protein